MSNETSKPAIEPALLDIDAVAALLDCSSMHIRRLSDSGRMPRPIKLGTLVRWRRALILEWLKAGCPPCDSKRPATHRTDVR